jgi:hypothetical protein
MGAKYHIVLQKRFSLARMLTGFICADNTDPLCFKFALQSPVAQMISHSSVLKWLLFPFFLLCGFEAHAAVAEVLTQPATDSQKSAFRRTLGEVLARSSDSIGVHGADGWIFFDNELRHLGSPCFWSVSPTAASSSTNPLPAILDFKSQLDKVGVELLVVPVPAKAAIYPDKLCSAVPAPPPEVHVRPGDSPAPPPEAAPASCKAGPVALCPRHGCGQGSAGRQVCQ